MSEEKVERHPMPLPVSIALGVLLALVVVGVVVGIFVGMHHESHYDCVMHNADRALANEPLKDCG